MNQNKVVLILGMHRSGTSFLANWLQSCGLQIGSNLYGKGIGNEEGHFEDWDFIELHRTALNERRWYKKRIGRFDFEAAAQKLIYRNNARYPQWSWKDPRTCLFLPQWHQLLPEARAVVIFRPYLHVVDSLLRRQAQVGSNCHPARKLWRYCRERLSRESSHDKFLKMWIQYNAGILNYLEKKKRQEYLVVELEQVLKQGEQIIDFFNHQGIALVYTPARGIFKKNLYQQEIAAARRFSPALLAQAEALLVRLQELSNQNEYA